MRGKEKCKALKEIRKQIAEKNDIEYAVSECTYQGECKGTCPKCEAELRYLERELEIRKGLGKVVAVTGISASVCAGLTACGPAEAVKDFVHDALNKVGIVEDIAGGMQEPDVIMGDVQIVEPTEEPTEEPVIEMDGDIQMPVEMETPAPKEDEESEEIIAGELPVMVPQTQELEGDVVLIETTE